MRGGFTREPAFVTTMPLGASYVRGNSCGTDLNQLLGQVTSSRTASLSFAVLST